MKKDGKWKRRGGSYNTLQIVEPQHADQDLVFIIPEYRIQTNGLTGRQALLKIKNFSTVRTESETIHREAVTAFA